MMLRAVRVGPPLPALPQGTFLPFSFLHLFLGTRCYQAAAGRGPRDCCELVPAAWVVRPHRGLILSRLGMGPAGRGGAGRRVGSERVQTCCCWT